MTPEQGKFEMNDNGQDRLPSTSRRRLLQGGAAAAPAILTLVSTPVRATYYTTPASSFASINSSRPRDTHTTNGCKPGWWKNQHVNSWPSSCVNVASNGSKSPKKFKQCFGDHGTYGEMTLKQCMEMADESGTNGLVKHLCAAYLNAASGKTPSELCGVPIARGMWDSYKTKGHYEPTAGIKWFADSCQPHGNGGCTPWLRTTMPYG